MPVDTKPFHTAPFLILAGWLNSAPDHWQSIWEARFGWQRVIQKDWLNPRKADWVAATIAAIEAQPHPPVIIAHSLGCSTLVHAVAERPDLKIKAAMLVAPVDFTGDKMPPEIQDFGPHPLTRLPFPSLVVASTTDPFCSIEHATLLAQHWGSTLKNVGPRDHIGSNAKLGDWVEGQELLAEFLRTVS